MKTKQIIVLFALAGLVFAPSVVWAITLNLNNNLRVASSTSERTVTNLNTNTGLNNNLQVEVPETTEIKPVNPIEVKALDPQPEPPAEINQVQVENQAEIGGINPQPEPPKTLNTNGILKPGEANGINPQPEPPVGTQVIDPDPPMTTFSLMKKCVMDYKKGSSQIDDEVTWGKCQEKYSARAGVSVLSQLKQCIMTSLQNGKNKIDDEVTWSGCESTVSDLSPQPDPPGLHYGMKLVKISDDVDALELVSLNPQPEPPLPGIKVSELMQWNNKKGQPLSGQLPDMLQGFLIKGEKFGEDQVLKFEKSESSSATSTTLAIDTSNVKFLITGNQIKLATSTLDFSAVADKIPVVEIKLRNATSSAPTMVKVKMMNNNAVLNFPKGEGEGTITIKSDFIVRDGKLVLSDGTNEIPISQNPDSFYQGITKGLKNKHEGIEVVDVNLGLEDNLPTYRLKLKEPVKLLGFIPFTINTELIANGVDNSVSGVKRPWYSFLLSKVDINNLKLVPDFAVTAVKLIPDTYKNGDSIVARVTITNIGTLIGISEYNFTTGSCTTINYYWGQSQIRWYCMLLALNPGDSADYEFNLNQAECEQFKVIFDPKQSIEEDSDFSNNTAIVQGNCSQ